VGVSPPWLGKRIGNDARPCSAGSLRSNCGSAFASAILDRHGGLTPAAPRCATCCRDCVRKSPLQARFSIATAGSHSPLLCPSLVCRWKSDSHGAQTRAAGPKSGERKATVVTPARLQLRPPTRRTTVFRAIAVALLQGRFPITTAGRHAPLLMCDAGPSCMRNRRRMRVIAPRRADTRRSWCVCVCAS